MALVVYNRVQETTTTTGTGTITLAGAVSGFQSFAVVGDGNTTYYTITSGTAWEVGIGTYTASGTTLARTTVLSNSLGTTAAISLTGTSNVFVTYPSEKSIYQDASGNVGIGTASPAATLDVQGSVRIGGTVGGNLIMPDLAGNPTIQLVTDTATAGQSTIVNNWANSSNPGIAVGTVRSDGTAFQVQTAIPIASGLPSGAGTAALHVGGDGNVGIGTVSPNVKLDVIGSIEASPAATQDGIIIAGRAGGTSSYAATLTPTTLTASRTITLPDATTTMVGTDTTQTLTNKTLTNPIIIGTIEEDVFTITDGAAFAIDPTNGSIQLITLGASRTPTQANWAAGEGITLMVNDGTAYTITWTTIGVVWVGGVAPTLATTGYTVIELWKVSTTIYGALVGSVA